MILQIRLRIEVKIEMHFVLAEGRHQYGLWGYEYLLVGMRVGYTLYHSDQYLYSTEGYINTTGEIRIEIEIGNQSMLAGGVLTLLQRLLKGFGNAAHIITSSQV